MKRKTGREHPKTVAIETTNRCNASCSFCPNSRLSRDRLTMNDELFEKIIEDCTVFKPHTIEPFLNGEPLMDRKIFDRMELIKRKLPETKIKIYTNGNLLSPDKIDKLAEIELDELFISLNTINRSKYKETMGLDLETTIKNLDYLTTRNQKKSVAEKITFRMTRTEDTGLFEQDQFIKYCKGKNISPFIVGLFNYKGEIKSLLPVPDYPCEHIDRIDILANGKVALCCMDQEGEYSWGDVRENTVLDVYNSEIARFYRKMHRTGKRNKVVPCNKCNLFWPTLRYVPLIKKITMTVDIARYFMNNKPTGRKMPVFNK